MKYSRQRKWRKKPKEEPVIFATDEIANQAQPLPRDWARLIQKLRWIGLDDEAARLEWAISNLPPEQRCELSLDPADTD
ncbi:MAG: hypothetical protein WCB70_00400 [Xanthobacteraceae bacterium]